jgi:hypothetical protein
MFRRFTEALHGIAAALQNLDRSLDSQRRLLIEIKGELELTNAALGELHLDLGELGLAGTLGGKLDEIRDALNASRYR